MIANEEYVVIIDDNIIDNRLYKVVDSAYDYDRNVITYFITDNSASKKISIDSHQIRKATQNEIYNNIKLSGIKKDSIVVYTDLLKSDALMVVTGIVKNSEFMVLNYFTKTTELLTDSDIRSARMQEITQGFRSINYNADLYHNYVNPFVLYSFYTGDYSVNPSHLSLLESLKLLDSGRLTINGERFYNDIDFDYLAANTYDFTSVSNETTYIATDVDGVVTEFKTKPNTIPMFDDITGRWYVIETDEEYVVSKGKITGMLEYDKYQISLKEVVR